jgi:putative hemolysin
MMTFLYVLGISALGVTLAIFSYIDRIYRELGRVNKGRIRAHLEMFENEIEPHFKLERARATLAFRLLANLWLVLVTAETARGVIVFVPGTWDALLQALVYVLVEVLLLSQFLPDFLLARTSGRWLIRLSLIIRAFLWIVLPFRVLLEIAISLARISDEQHADEIPTQGEGIEALVDAAEHEGILDPGEVQMIEQVVEFSDKRVREVMTPRPDIVAVAAESTLEELHAKFVDKKFSKMPVYEKTLDDIFGVVYAQDLLHIADQDLPKRKVRELARPVLFIPETKAGSDLLREMRQKAQPFAVVIDEHGSVAGIATVEDLVEEIVGESGYDAKQPLADVVREPDGGLVMRGSMSIDDVEELLGVRFGEESDAAVTTIAGLLSHVSGKVPEAGDKIELEGHKFEVLESNQRKVLRVRVRKSVPTVVGVEEVRKP